METRLAVELQTTTTTGSLARDEKFVKLSPLQKTIACVTTSVIVQTVASPSLFQYF